MMCMWSSPVICDSETAVLLPTGGDDESAAV